MVYRPEPGVPVGLVLAGAMLLLSCSDAGLYALEGRGAGRADRAELVGTACMPLAAGPAFPVKVLFAVQGGEGVSREQVGQLSEALMSLADRFSGEATTFALVAFHTVATGLQGSFVDAAGFQQAVARYGAYQEQGPISLRAPLRLARSLLSGDMLASCRGTLARTRYLVVPIVLTADTACAHPELNPEIDARCNALLPDAAACSACELTRVTAELKALAEARGAGEVSVQPLYLRTEADSAVRVQLAAIARSGGTEAREVDPAGLSAALHRLDYAGLQQPLTLKRLFAFNRNGLVRGGQQLADSDGDGVADVDEEAVGSSPVLADTDGDGLSDGVERRMGLDALVPDVLTACNPALDSDGDRLNDCEERALGTDACTADSDGDGFPELVELAGGTNLLVPERLQDEDRDGRTNAEELAAHTDPLSADLASAREDAYRVELEEDAPTADGRACFRFRTDNIPLLDTLARPNPPFSDVPRGTNDVHLYLVAGHADDPGGAGISSLRIERFTFTPPASRLPAGGVPVLPEEFVLGR